jgi:hypothetical protein
MATRTLPTPVPRETLSARIEALELPQAKGYADFIRAGDPGSPVPCWGAIADRFQQDFKKTADRKALWAVLLEEGDRRPLLLYLHANRDRPEVMAMVLEEADRLPLALQRALVSFEEVADLLPARLDKLDPAARQLFEAGPEALGREREQFAARIAQLMAFRYFVPDQRDPAIEPGAVKSTAGALATETTSLDAGASRAIDTATPTERAVAVEPVPAGTTGGDR